MPISDAKRKADYEWRRRALEQVAIRVRKGTKEVWKQAADAAGMSLASYIQQAVKEKMERDADENHHEAEMENIS